MGDVIRWDVEPRSMRIDHQSWTAYSPDIARISCGLNKLNTVKSAQHESHQGLQVAYDICCLQIMIQQQPLP